MRFAILCPGQGDQAPAMFDMLRSHAAARLVLEEASEILSLDILALDVAHMTKNAIAQPILCAVAMASFACLKPYLPEPSVFIGYSVGELASYSCAGALTLRQTLALAQARARLMDEAGAFFGNTGSLMAVRGIVQEKLKPLCAQHACEFAIINAADKIVVGGAREDLLRLTEAVQTLGGKTTPLSITIASHTSQMQSAVAPFAEALASMDFARLTAPVLSGLDGSAITNKAQAVKTLAAQIATPLRFDLCLERMTEMGITTALELLPGNGLSRIVNERFGADATTPIVCRAVSEFRTLDGVIKWIEKIVTQG